MTDDGDDSGDGQLKELHERIETLEEAGDILEETADAVQERTAPGEGSVDSRFDSVDDATDGVNTDTATNVAAGPVDLLPSRKRLLGFAGGALLVFLGVTLLGISVVLVLVSRFLFCVTVLEIAATAVVPCREYLPDDLLGGALLGLVVGSVAFFFASLAEFAVGRYEPPSASRCRTPGRCRPVGPGCREPPAPTAQGETRRAYNSSTDERRKTE